MVAEGEDILSIMDPRPTQPSCTMGTKLLSPGANRPRRRDKNLPYLCACLARNGTVLLLWKVSKADPQQEWDFFRGVDVDL